MNKTNWDDIFIGIIIGIILTLLILTKLGVREKLLEQTKYGDNPIQDCTPDYMGSCT